MYSGIYFLIDHILKAKTLKIISEALTGLNGLIMGLKFRTISPLQLLYIEGFQKIEYLMRYHPWL